mgnify:CR=1
LVAGALQPNKQVDDSELEGGYAIIDFYKLSRDAKPNSASTYSFVLAIPAISAYATTRYGTVERAVDGDTIVFKAG